MGLIDEYRARVCPVLDGGGIPFFPQHEHRANLELNETRALNSRVLYLRYRVATAWPTNRQARPSTAAGPSL